MGTDAEASFHTTLHQSTTAIHPTKDGGEMHSEKCNPGYTTSGHYEHQL